MPEPLFVEYEWVTEDSTFREAMIPAAELNKHRRRVLAEEEIDELTLRRFDSFWPKPDA